ncbi:MAG: biotin--[acetyl-CoA-carboxylase] ligase [Solirubrobacterales bacterium]|nr:biotin--[acetyl-CoA-carboxylase] ligase [Solirubrobacterales bacterium]
MTDLGLPHLHLRLTDSTNERARGLAAAGAPSGTIVTADEQSAGRGRRGRAWSAPPRAALLYSAILRPLGAAHALLPLAVPVAVCEAIESLAPRSCAIKWPNDVWIAERKVSGVLIEARPPDWAVIGIGVNVAIEDGGFPADLRWPATSIGGGVAVDRARDAVCEALGRWVDAPAAEVLDAFRARDALAGRALAWEGAGTDAGTGVGAGVDERGNLLVDADSGDRLALGAGEVQLRPASAAAGVRPPDAK